MWVIFKIQGIIQMCIFVWNTQPTSTTLLSSIDQNIYCIQLDICFSPAKVRSQIEAASPASSPRCQAEVAVSLASLVGGEAGTVVVWWCIQYILDLFEWNFNQSLNLAGCLPQSSPPPASLPSHTPITNTTHSNSVLYRTVSTLEKKLKNSLTFFVLFYILSINLKQTV